jgi:plastocyanin
MKVSSISALSGLLAVASAQRYTETIPVVCTGAPFSTVTETVTVTANNGGGSYPTGSNHDASAPPASVTTSAGMVTSISYEEGPGSRSSVWVYPTGNGHKEATCSVYVDNVIIQIIVVDINVQIINGTPQTVTVTKSESPITTDGTTTLIPPTSIPFPPGTITTTPPYKQNTTTYSSGPTGTSTPKVHYVTVGARGKNLYEPNQLDANVGDIIRFNFLARNHTVTQSNFATPCEFNGGFDTGFNQFNPTNATGVSRDFIVDTTKPTWFFCAQTIPASHCKAGMVLGINPAGKFDQFLDMAKKSGSGPATGTGVTKIASSTGISTPTGTGSAKPTGWAYKYPAIKGRAFQA